MFIRTLNSVYALDIARGNVIWRTVSPCGSSLCLSPQTYKNYLVVPINQSGIEVLSIETGNSLWHTYPFDERGKAPAYVSNSSFAIYEDMLFVARNNWRLTAYPLDQGKIIIGESLWEKNIPSRTSLDVVVDSGIVYLSAQDSVKAYDIEQGRILWEQEFGTLVDKLLLDERILYISLPFGEKTKLIALDLDTHSEIWAVSLDEIQDVEIGHLAQDEKVLYASGSHIIAIDKTTGSIIWANDLEGFLESPIVSGGKIFVRNIETTLYVLNRERARK